MYIDLRVEIGFDVPFSASEQKVKTAICLSWFWLG